MNRVLWSKAWHDAWPLLTSLGLLLFAFNWLYVWLSSLVELGALAVFLSALPPAFEQMLGVPFSKVATPSGRIAVAYVDPIVIFSAVAWGIARGSDVVAGELGRGTLEMLLAQPIRRISLIITHAVASTLGALALALAAWGGTCAGLATVTLAGSVEARDFLPGALNLFGLMVCLGGLSTLVSSWETLRWRVIGVVAGVYVLSLIIKIVARMVSWLDWMMYVTFLGAFEPQSLAISPVDAWQRLCVMNGVLVGLGLAAYALAAVVFEHRDLPA
jgi:ABC-2 type transport system permease protein